MPRRRQRRKQSLLGTLIGLIIIFIIYLIQDDDDDSKPKEPPLPELIGIGGGGAFFTPLISPINPNDIYVTSDMGGLYYSHDKGKNWKRSTEVRGVFKTAHITSNGTVFVGGFGLYASFTNGEKLQLIYPQNVKAQVSRYGWNENLMLAEGFDNGYLKSICSSKRKIYFITIDWYANLRLIESDYTGNTKQILYNETLSGVNDPMDVDIYSIYDEDRICYSIDNEIKCFVFEDKMMITLYEGMGKIRDFKKIEGNYFIIEDNNEESKILKTDDFITFENIHEMNLLETSFIDNEDIVTFRWNYTQITGTKLNSIFISSSNSINEYNDLVEGILKFNGISFEWIFDNVFKPKHNLNLTGWSYGSHGPFYGIYASAKHPYECLVTNIETVYLMSYQSNTSYSIDNLHSNPLSSQSEFFTTRGLDVQTTYWVKEDPFNSKHLIIATTDMGLQISHDNGNSWRRMKITEQDWSIYNTCYDLYFDTDKKNTVYGIWSSQHDAPYQPSYYYKDTTKGKFAISYDGGVVWNFTYSSGIPEDSIPIKMNVVKNETSLTIAVACFNRGFYVSYDSGKTFESINEGMETNEELIFGEDVVIVKDVIYCLTAPIYENNEYKSSKLYKYFIKTKVLEIIDIGELVLLRSITYHEKFGLLISVIPTNEYQWYEEFGDGIQVNKNGGLYVYDGKEVKSFFKNTDGIFNCGVLDDKRIYAVDTYGKVFEYNGGIWELKYGELFRMLKNVGFSKNKKYMYVTTFGGGTYKIEL